MAGLWLSSIFWMTLLLHTRGISEQELMWRNNTETSEFYIYESKKKFDEAQNYCSNLGGSLAKVDNSKINEAIREYVKGRTESFWIGGTDRKTEGDWKWIDGEKFSYTNWDKDQPSNWRGNEDCAVIWSDGKWNDMDCNLEADEQLSVITGFICQKDRWQQWAVWSLCSNSCSPGIQARERHSVSGDDVEKQTKPCNTKLCDKYSKDKITCIGKGKIPTACKLDALDALVQNEILSVATEEIHLSGGGKVKAKITKFKTPGMNIKFVRIG